MKSSNTSSRITHKKSIPKINEIQQIESSIEVHGDNEVLDEKERKFYEELGCAQKKKISEKKGKEGK